MPEKKHLRMWLWILIVSVLLGVFPGAVRAEGTAVLRRVFAPEELTDGSYALVLSGQAMGSLTEEGEISAVTPVMAEGRPAVMPEILWTLTKTEEGFLLTDPAGTELPSGEGHWNIDCENTLFRFSAVTEEGTVTFGYTGDSFAVAEVGQEGILRDFSLFYLTEQEISEEEPQEETPPEAQLYFGLLHAHTACSDGTGTMEEAFAKAAEEMDFLAVTDHSDSLTDAEWEAGKTVAELATSEDFAALRGYEMSWPERLRLGHIGVFHTQGYMSWQEDTYKNYNSGLEHFYAALAGEKDAVGQFQHPGNFYGTFKNFTYNEEADRVISLLEVACEGETFYSAYTSALDAGWHVAPTFGGNTHAGGACGTETGRTVVRMESLTPENLKEALKNRRTYATEDADLQILYSLDGYEMGDIVPVRRAGATAELDVTVSDPTDADVGTVEVIGPGGAVLTSVPATSNPERLTLSLPSDRAYYYLRITQPDGDVAITAPVWVEQEEKLGIAEFACDTSVVTQDSPVELTVTFFNEEKAPLEVTAMELHLDGEPVAKWEESFRVETDTSPVKQLSYTHEKLGPAELTLHITATLEGQPRSYAETLTLSVRKSELVTGILVDGTHGNAGLESLGELTALAASRDIQVTVCREALTGEMLADCALLVVNSPAEDFSDEFLAAVAEFVSCGGELLVCADDPTRAGELNRLLATVGSSMYFTEELQEHRPREFNRQEDLCAGVNEKQLFYVKRGCALEPGEGTWLVKDQHILLAREEVGSGSILACGSLLAADPALKSPASLWEEDYANRTIVQALLGIQQQPLSISTIRQVRAGETGEIYRIQGYVTATTFPETLFLQDQTGGIGIMPFREEKISQGRAVEVIGTLAWQEGEPVLVPVSLEQLSQSGHWYRPQDLNCREAQDGETYGGALVQVTGICVDRTLGSDGTLQTFVLKDSTGKKLEVVIGDTIVSSSTGKNTLHTVVKKDEEIWAIGILQTDEAGKTFLRVRNCAEVVAVAPNPYTGDTGLVFHIAMLLSGFGLAVILTGKRFRFRKSR